jgi:isochorismate pyruvate lyase
MTVNRNFKSPEDCENKEEIRQQIDRIDAEILQLFAQRNKYVHAIVKFKVDEESVIAKDRKEQVIKNRGLWAEELGLDRKTFEEIYKILINTNIETELKILKNQ